MKQFNRIIISGGGTGGHIFPAVAIANALKLQHPDIEILFVGALGRMEMEKVPAAGYQIKGLPIAGFQRRLTVKNVSFFYKLAKSLWMARRIVREFQPDVVVGVGGYASGPMLRAAGWAGVPTLIQEQNSYAGVTNKLLAKKAQTICVAYDGMERFFQAEKLVVTGNPVRQGLEDVTDKRDEAIDFFGLDSKKKTILLIGGSLGARTLNRSVIKHLETIGRSEVQFIWQTGKIYSSETSLALQNTGFDNIKRSDFITRMDLAYAVADVVISRAGAISISELCLVKKPSILVPSPNVAEDHQTKNALALVNKNAAILIRDVEAENKLIDEALRLVNDIEQCRVLSENIGKLAKTKAADTIASEVIKLAKKR